MNLLRTLFVAVVLVSTAFAAGSQQITFQNNIKYPLKLVVDGVYKCTAPAKKSCVATVSVGQHHFAAVDSKGVEEGTSEHYVDGDDSSSTWTVYDPEKK